jgi:hypothetical protein
MNKEGKKEQMKEEGNKENETEENISGSKIRK